MDPTQYESYPAYVCPECGSEMIDERFVVEAWASVLKWGDAPDIELYPNKLTAVDHGDYHYGPPEPGEILYRCVDCECDFIQPVKIEEPEPEDGFVDLCDFDEEMME